MLTEYDLEEHDRRKLQSEMLSLSRNTSDMLTNLLYWSSARIKGIKLYKTSVNIRQVIEKVLRIQVVLAKAKSVEIVTDVTPALFANADVNIVELILRNLVHNAIKFTPRGGRVTISAKPYNNGCLCVVSDTGIGMRSEDLNKLFKLQPGGLTHGTNNEKGTGLGLMLCHEFVGLLSGRLWAKSTIGKGSEFYVFLPAENAYTGMHLA